MKILFIVPYPKDVAPSQRLKFEQYFTHFKANGIEIEFSPFISTAFRKILYERGHYLKKCWYVIQGYARRVKDIFRSRHFDIIYLHLEVAPFGPPVFEQIFHMMKKPIVYDIDDVIYLPHSSDANKSTQFLKCAGKIPEIIRLSSHVIVVTDYLAEFARRFNANITCIPPTVDTDKYFIKNKGPGGKICVGWSGSHSTSKYLLLLKDVLKNIAGRYDVRIKVIGDKNFRIEGLDIEAKDWSMDAEVEDLQDIDIGLYPLPKDEWVMGKGGLKALQYMGIGIPPVCTRIGAVLRFIKDGENGFLAESDEEWMDKITKLIENPGLRKRMGFAARNTIEENYSVKVNAPRYLEVIKKVQLLTKSGKMRLH
ncbi:MAG: glycosyltransferase family 4 protein [Candidatus Omnitrophica bacterium]|nr:glycosyltransferase family 4 protein [Candidatus Omnitrophota bacterium]